jgi:SAM-dependent methyltransferase
MSDARPTERFSDRVCDYVAARPGYPPGIIDSLRAAGALPTGSVVADIGSGTGISAGLFLEAGCRVIGVEPNAAMRAAAEERFSRHPAFRSIAGTAEATTLASRSVNLVAAGQAFHWFDAAASSGEFARILKAGGWITLFWNTRDHTATPFMAGLEELVRRFGTDYERVHHEQLPEASLELVMPRNRRSAAIPNVQRLDRTGLHARLLSASYLPSRGTPRAEEMVQKADSLFDRHARAGVVEIHYRTQQYTGQPGS